MTTALLDPVDDLTHRRLLGGAGALGAWTLLAGCATPAPPTVPEPATTRAFRDATGADVEIPVRPERIVVLDDFLAAGLLPLGGTVVGMPVADVGGFREEYAAEEFDLSGVTDFGGLGEPDLEAIARLQPDLLVQNAFAGETFIEPSMRQQLQQIAPLVALESGVGVEDATATSAELLGATATVDPATLRAEFEMALGELREVLGDRWSETTVSLFDYRPSDVIFTFGTQTNPVTEPISMLGVAWTAPHDGANAAGGFAELSTERLGEFDVDLIFVLTAFSDGAQMADVATFARLPAVEAGQVVEIDRSFSVERALADAAARHLEWDGASAVLASFYSEGQLYVYDAANSGSYLLTSLGFVIPEEPTEFTEDPTQVPDLRRSDVSDARRRARGPAGHPGRDGGHRAVVPDGAEHSLGPGTARTADRRRVRRRPGHRLTGKRRDRGRSMTGCARRSSRLVEES